MATIILPHNHFETDHLEAVKSEMTHLGAPVIKAVWMEVFDAWVALKGAHRIRAAAVLGLTPEIEEVEWSDSVTTDEIVPGSYDDIWTIKQICDDAHTRKSIEF
jgi:hypothetical protein